MRKKILIGLILVFLLLSCSSKTVDFKIENINSFKAQKNQTLTSGAAKTNISPPPGLPIAGFSVMSSYARGKRTNLMARVIYLNPAKGKSLALVQCDLLSGSMLVRSKVAELVSKKTDLGYKGILMVGTHTHSGPGNYFGSGLFNDHASNDSGFDKHYFHFLSQSIAKTVVEAYQNRRPAKLATGTVKIDKNVTQNRSFPAYLENENVNASRVSKYNAVNPYMHMVRIDCLDKSGTYKPLGAFSNFSIHPNTKPELLGALYNGDIFAYIEREVEFGIQKHYKLPWEPVHAATNYLHGDNNPDYNEKNGECFRELQRIGTIIGKRALKLFLSLEEDLKKDVEIQLRAKEVNMLRDKSGGGYKICDPALGNAQLAGAGGKNKHTVLYHVPLFAPGWPMDTGGCQGGKRITFGPLQYLFVDKEEFPHILFLQAIRIDNFVYTPLPFEITCEMGRRIAEQNKAMAEKTGLEGVDTFIPISCSNGYFGYVTTPEEYSLQYYEGGSNLYGPDTGYYLASHLDQLVAGLAEDNTDFELIEDKSFNMEVESYYPEALEPKGKRKIVQGPTFHENTKQGESYWSFKWYDVSPGLISFNNRLIQIEYFKNSNNWQVLKKNKTKVDDTGYDIAIIYLDELNETNMGLYEARWYTKDYDIDDIGKFRFAVLPRGNQQKIFSTPFETHN